MNSAKKQPNNHLSLLLAFFAAAALFLHAGCGTVTPKPVASPAASYDGGERNSGLIGFQTNGEALFLVVTPHWRDRYNALAAEYGVRFRPAVTADYGLTITQSNILVTPEAFTKMASMNRWKKTEGK